MRTFAWEHGLRGPTPVVYHDGKPSSKAFRMHDVTDRDDLFSVDGSPIFGALMREFPHGIEPPIRLGEDVGDWGDPEPASVPYDEHNAS